MDTVFEVLKPTVDTVKRFIQQHIKPIHIVLAIVLILQWAILARISKPLAGDFVSFQQIQGIRKGAIEHPLDPKKTEQKIALFSANLMRTGYDWQPEQGATEEGISYPKNFHAASFYFDMESDLRQKWLLSRAVKYQKAGFSFQKFLDGDYLSTVQLSGNPIVKQLSQNTWQAEVRAVRVVVTPQKKAEGAAFKEKLGFQFVIKAIQPRSGHAWGLETSELNHTIHKIQADGLQIVDFQELA